MVAGTATEITGEGLDDLISCGRIVLCQQRLCSQQDARSTVATLGRSEIGETRLKRMQFVTLHHALDRLDRSALALGGQFQATENRLAIDQHGTGATFAQLTAMLGAGETQFFPEHLQQTVMDGKGDLLWLTVDPQGPGGGLLRHVPPIRGFTRRMAPGSRRAVKALESPARYQ